MEAQLHAYRAVIRLWSGSKRIGKSQFINKLNKAINSNFRKVTKKGAFPNETALLKLLYLRVMELEKKWQNGHIANWSLVLNQLMVNEQFHDRISKYLNK